jgi:hypothetical protein
MSQREQSGFGEVSCEYANGFGYWCIAGIGDFPGEFVFACGA